MDIEEKEQWEEIIRSKLVDIEAETDPDLWEVIAERLPAGKKVMLPRRWYYIAAGIAIFIMITGGYFYFNSPDETQNIAEITETGIDESTNSLKSFDEIRETEQSSNSLSSLNALSAKNSFNTTIMKESVASLSDLTQLPVSQKIQLEVKRSFSKEEVLRSFQTWNMKRHTIEYLADDFGYLSPKNKRKRWSFGTGGGSLAMGTTGGGFVSASRSSVYTMDAMNDGDWYMGSSVKRDDYFNEMLINSVGSISINSAGITKEGLTHKQPISLGIGVGYALNDRWSLQSGLVYTLLSSSWRVELSYQAKSRQHLHFVGIPLGLSYQFAEWNKIRFYATTGGMVESNLSGIIKTDYYINELKASTEKESVRIKELQWSVNARVGATYPVIKFVNAYVEGGANYYFDNKSLIENIRSDKPFHVSLQAGLRFGF